MKINKAVKKLIVSVLLILALLAGICEEAPAFASTAVVASGKIGNNSWQLDSDGVLTLSGNDEFVTMKQESVPWYGHRSDIKKVVFAMSRVSGGDMSGYFADSPKLASVNNIPLGVEKMQESFLGCRQLRQVGTIPETVVSITRAFKNCSSLNQQITIPGNVVEASGLFDGCLALAITPVIQSDRIEDMSYMFRHTALTSAPRLSKATRDLSYTFSQCDKLKAAPEIPETVELMDHTFEYCYEMTSASSIPPNVKSMSYCFTYCMELMSAPVITSKKLENMSGAFSYCYDMQTAPGIPGSVKNLDYAFYNCQSMRTLPDIPPNVTTMRYCLACCGRAEGSMTIYTVIKDPEKYHCFAGDTALYSPHNKPYYLGGTGKGVTVNYVKNNKDDVIKYLSRGWNCGALVNNKYIEGLSLGESKEQKIADCTVKGLKSFTYTGKGFWPEPEIYYSSLKLKMGTDYSLSYENNVNAGTAVIHILGKGNYTGRRIAEFTIQEAVFSTVKAYSYTGVYDGKPHSIAVAQDEGGTIEYGTEEGQFTMDKCPEYTLPGTYRTYFRVVKPNYVTYTGSADVTIEKNTLQVQSEGYSGDYDGNPHSISIQTEKEAVVRYGTKKGEYTTTICPSYVNVGRYNVYFEVTRTGYETFYGMRMVIIKRKQIHEMTFPTASAIQSGERLGSSMLFENYNEYGIFSWKTPNVIPEVGSGSYPVVFEPKDLVNYDFSEVEGYDAEEKKITRQVTVQVTVPTPKPTPTSIPDVTSSPVPSVTPNTAPNVTPDGMPGKTWEPDKKPEPGASGKPEASQKPDDFPGTSPIVTISPEELQEEQGISQWIQMFDNWQERKYAKTGEKVRRPDRVKIKEIKRKKKRIYIRWKKIGRAAGYQVLYSPKRSIKKGVKRKNVRKTRTSFKWKYSQKCYVKIRAYSINGKKKMYGKWSQIRRVKVS
ncbi:MAG: leucine-rich repeat protein [Eubacterium sp.]|nr:leucine-rich repeat protein [Eubacterium sp.]